MLELDNYEKKSYGQNNKFQIHSILAINFFTIPIQMDLLVSFYSEFLTLFLTPL